MNDCEFVASFTSILVILKYHSEGDAKPIPCIEGENGNYLVSASSY